MDSDKVEPPLVTLAQFEGCTFNDPVSGLSQVGMTAISIAYRQAMMAADPSCKEVFRLLADIAGIHLTPADRGKMWVPGVQMGSGRTMLPSDIRGEQSDVIEAVLPAVRHPALQARLADVVWSNDLRKGAAARIAVEAYCACVDGLMSGEFGAVHPVNGRNLVDAQVPAQRALQIASAIKKKSAPLPDRVGNALKGLYHQALREAQPFVFSRFAQLCVDYSLIEPRQAAQDLESVGTASGVGIPPEVIRMALDYAGVLYGRVNDDESELRCQMGAVRQMLRMRDECAQAGAKASWVMDALLRLRRIKTDEAAALELELESDLRLLQRASMRELGTFEVDIRMPAEKERILGHFAAMDFSTALKSFALLEPSPKIEDLKAAALKRAEDNPLSGMMGVKHVDDEGRTVVNTAGAGSGSEEPPDEWFVRMFAEAESYRRAVVVANAIDPVRTLIGQTVAIEERHFAPIVWESPFVPQLQAPLYTLGFARFFQGDFASAAYILFPQLEPSLRHILRAHGADPTKRREDATEENRSLDAIILNHRNELLAMMGEPLLEEVNRIFNVQPGPTLRHDVAHGEMSAGQCYSADVVYGCWLLYKLCALSLVEKWDERVGPALAMEEPGR
jgi:hypothetical protein